MLFPLPGVVSAPNLHTADALHLLCILVQVSPEEASPTLCAERPALPLPGVALYSFAWGQRPSCMRFTARSKLTYDLSLAHALPPRIHRVCSSACRVVRPPGKCVEQMSQWLTRRLV